MCGFVGYFDGSKRPVERAMQGRLGAALDLIAHRGPDDRATAGGDGWWMGFRRLAILDLSEAGRQPMSFGGGRYTLCFNGEIYNYAELRGELEGEVQSSGDTEVLGRLLEERGVAATLPKLRGMFAFSWWDAVEGRLWLARDPFGIKPLYYHLGKKGKLTVGSELRAVVAALPSGARRLSKGAVVDCLRWGSVQAPATAYAGVTALAPGCVAEWKGGKLAAERYFEPKWERKENWIVDEKELAAELRKAVTGSVRAHLVSDVPVGLFLSGGLDSSIVCAAMREAGVDRIEAFSVGYEGDAGVEDESEAATRTAGHFGAAITTERISAEDLYEAFEACVEHLDAPTGDALNVYLVARNAARMVKVALSGTGADEMFGGYNYYRMIGMAQKLPLYRGVPPQVVKKVLGPVFQKLPPGLQVNRAARVAAYMLGVNGADAAEMYFGGKSLLRREAVDELLAGGLNGTASREALLDEDAAAARAAGPDSWLHRVLYLESTRYLPNTLLRDSDDMTMAHSLELRLPFVDPEIMRLSARTPPGAMLNAGGGKRILREAFADVLPSWIREDRKKKTFTLPLMKWLRQPRWRDRVQDVLGSKRCRDRGIFEPAQVEKHLNAFYSSSDAGKRNFVFSQRVWQLFVLESWAQSHIDGQG